MSDPSRFRIGWRDVSILFLALGVGAVIVGILLQNLS